MLYYQVVPQTIPEVGFDSDGKEGPVCIKALVESTTPRDTVGTGWSGDGLAAPER